MTTQNRVKTHFIPTSQLKLYDVVNNKGEDLGQVQNFIIDMCGARIAYVLVAFEGFLGLGDKWIPIPFEVLKWMPEKNRFMMEFPRSRMEKAPTISKAGWPDKFLGQLELQEHSSWLEEVYDYWDCTPYWIVHEGDPCRPGAGEPMAATVAYIAPEPETMAPVEHIHVTAMPAAMVKPAQMPEPARMPSGDGEMKKMKVSTKQKMETHFIPTSRLQYYDVIDKTGVEVGKVERIIVDMASGRVAYMLVGLQGHPNDKWVAVPPDVMTWDSGKKNFELNVSRQTVEKAPIIPKSDWPDKFLLDLEKQDHLDWLEDVYGYYQVTPFWIVIET